MSAERQEFKENDVVFSFTFGLNGIVKAVVPGSTVPIRVEFEDGSKFSYGDEGKIVFNAKNPDIFKSSGKGIIFAVCLDQAINETTPAEKRQNDPMKSLLLYLRKGELELLQ